MNERRSSGFSSDVDEDLMQNDKKKIKISGSSSDESVNVHQDDFNLMWEKLVLQLRRILQLKTVEAVRIAEDAYNLSVKGSNRPRLIDECNKFLNQFCTQLAQTLTTVKENSNLLTEYYRNWRAYLLAVEDINTIIKVFRIQGIVKLALSAWWFNIFTFLRFQLKTALDQQQVSPIDVSFMDLCSESDLIPNLDNHMNDMLSYRSEQTGHLSIFAPYQEEFNELFKLSGTLKQLFPREEWLEDDEDEFLYEDILKMKLPNVNISSSKEEGINGVANTAPLPAELVFEIFTFLGTEKELITVGQVCRRWYVLTKQRSLWHALKARKLVSKDLVRLYSKEGHEFTIGLAEVNRSATLASVLKMHTAVEAKTHTVRFTTIHTNILEKIVQYFYYKVMYTNCPSTTIIPDFPIESEIALEILMASNFLDC